MPVYNKTWLGVALSTSNSTWELVTTATGEIRVLEHYYGGEATSSTVLRTGIMRVNAQGTGTAPTAYTPNLFKSGAVKSVAAASTVYGANNATIAWGTAQETLFDPMVTHAFNAFGGTDRWVPQPGEEIYTNGGSAAGSISSRSLSGTPITSGHMIFEEL